MLADPRALAPHDARKTLAELERHLGATAHYLDRAHTTRRGVLLALGAWNLANLVALLLLAPASSAPAAPLSAVPGAVAAAPRPLLLLYAACVLGGSVVGAASLSPAPGADAAVTFAECVNETLAPFKLRYDAASRQLEHS